MAGQVAHVPGRGRAAARQLRGDVHDGHEVQLHPAEGLRLVKAEEPGLVQGLLVLANSIRACSAFWARSRRIGTISRARRIASA